jgi:hypothetical protein
MRQFKHVLVGLAAIAAVLPAGPTPTRAGPWEIHVFLSDSDESYTSNTSTPWVGEKTLYLWNVPFAQPSLGAEFAFEGSLEIVALTPRPGVTNSGTATFPVLAYPECSGFLVVAEVVVRDAAGTGGSICFGVSDQLGVNCSVQCDSEQFRSHIYHGFSSDGSEPCAGWDHLEACEPVALPVEPNTWGRVKGRYQD